MTGCEQQNQPQKMTKTEIENPAIQLMADDGIPEARIQKQAYALGATFATRLSESLSHPQNLGIELDEQYVLQGIKDVFEGHSIIPPAAASELLEALQEDIAQANISAGQ
ncbi:FKBP-type peptidyl-prolyl cis-trans isomerase FkpA precursor [Vibrio astriarenae]|nr:FKBP-type peptidyl-prolyl cis-trans isomerase FkpA precursor [Vibrio sp. C7]